MKFRTEINFIHVSDTLGPEKKAEVETKLKEHIRGWEQAEKGKAKRELVNIFLDFLDPARVADLEEEIKRLHTIQDFNRFRIDTIILAFEAFIGGMSSPIRLRLGDKSEEATP